ncbi:MAG TPA: SpoIIE family protein phosphatase [Bryobacteraceae bacterium]|nr:SpoIIE family protein phosphatase [Bryobacteraceae bacterium]
MAHPQPSPFREILIQCPDGQTKIVPLRSDRFVVGRSSTAEVCFPEDAGLSRQHMVLERDGDSWSVQDLGSKNGTLVNNIPLRARLRLKPGDRITAGHLAIIYDPNATGARPASDVVFFESGEADPPSTATILTSLEGALSSQTIVDRPGQQGVKQVQALIRAGQELAGRGTLSDLFPLILDLAIDGVGAQRGVVMTLEGDELEVKANKGDGFRISSAVRDRVLNEKASVLVRDAQMDEAFRERMSIVEQKVRTLMAVPLQTATRTIGLIYVDSPNMFRAFTKDDLSLLTVMANVAAIRIEHARLAEVEEVERRMARELEQAAEIQRSFLPGGAPQVAGADLAGYNAPCRTVGGDYYDFFTYPNGRVAMVLGDVSGKGMPASLMMMGLQARVQVLADEPQDLAAVINRLNKITCKNCPSNRFITFFFCVLDPVTGELVYCNAGHNPPVIVRANGSVEYLEGGGPVLGILSIANYSDYRAKLEPGDLLAIYSDGVTEATNGKEDEFGDERFAAVLAANRQKNAAEIVTAVSQALADFAAGAPQADDITLIAARRL